MYASSLSPYSNFLLSINSKKYINNYYFKIPQLRLGLPTSTYDTKDGPLYFCGAPMSKLAQNLDDNVSSQL
jgi:hypothetical protein